MSFIEIWKETEEEINIMIEEFTENATRIRTSSMLDFLSILTKVSKIFQLDDITILSATNALASANLAFNALLQRPGHYRNLFDNEITANGTFRNEVLDGLQFKESVSKQQKKLVKLCQKYLDKEI